MIETLENYPEWFKRLEEACKPLPTTVLTEEQFWKAVREHNTRMMKATKCQKAS
jgi:hypothetical protein